MTNDQKTRVLKMVLATLQQAQQKSGNLNVDQTKSALTCVKSVLDDNTSTATAADTTTVTDIATLILQILQLILSNLPTGTLVVSPADTTTDIADIGEIILQILELLLAKLGQPSPTPAPTPAPADSAALSPVDIATLILQILQLVLSKFAPPAPPSPTPPAA
jgi:hypothetical protein